MIDSIELQHLKQWFSLDENSEPMNLSSSPSFSSAMQSIGTATSPIPSVNFPKFHMEPIPQRVTSASDIIFKMKKKPVYLERVVHEEYHIPIVTNKIKSLYHIWTIVGK